MGRAGRPRVKPPKRPGRVMRTRGTVSLVQSAVKYHITVRRLDGHAMTKPEITKVSGELLKFAVALATE